MKGKEIVHILINNGQEFDIVQEYFFNNNIGWSKGNLDIPYIRMLDYYPGHEGVTLLYDEYNTICISRYTGYRESNVPSILVHELLTLSIEELLFNYMV